MQIVTGELYKTFLNSICKSLSYTYKIVGEEYFNGIIEEREESNMGRINRNPYIIATDSFCDTTWNNSTKNELLQIVKGPRKRRDLLSLFISFLYCGRSKKYSTSNTHFAGFY